VVLTAHAHFAQKKTFFLLRKAAFPFFPYPPFHAVGLFLITSGNFSLSRQVFPARSPFLSNWFLRQLWSTFAFPLQRSEKKLLCCPCPLDTETKQPFLPSTFPLWAAFSNSPRLRGQIRPLSSHPAFLPATVYSKPLATSPPRSIPSLQKFSRTLHFLVIFFFFSLA